MKFIGNSTFSTSGWFSPALKIEGWFSREVTASSNVVVISEGYRSSRRKRLKVQREQELAAQLRETADELVRRVLGDDEWLIMEIA